jgi:hypothetical protein
MGIGRLIDWIDRRVDKPADQTVLTDPRGGSERMIKADDPEVAKAAADNVQRDRTRRRIRHWRP